jgi:hypothetical protein
MVKLVYPTLRAKAREGWGTRIWVDLMLSVLAVARGCAGAVGAGAGWRAKAPSVSAAASAGVAGTALGWGGGFGFLIHGWNLLSSLPVLTREWRESYSWWRIWEKYIPQGLFPPHLCEMWATRAQSN